MTDQSDIAIETASYIAEKMHLQGIGSKYAKLYTNKFLMRKFSNEIEINSPKYQTVKNKKEAKNFIKKYKYPVIIKPLVNQSSKGVFKLENDKELNTFFPLSLKYRRKHNFLLIEQFIDGEEFTVEGFKTINKHYSLAISKKKHFKFATAVAMSLFYEPVDQNGKYKELIKLNNFYIEKSNLPFGITHAEYKYMNGKYYLIEIAARGGGNKISSHIVPMSSGVDVNKYLIDLVLGKKINKIKIKNTGFFILLYFFNFKEGEVFYRTPKSKIKNLDFVMDFDYNFKLGEKLKRINSDRTRHAYVIIKDKNKLSIFNNIEKIKNIINLKYV